MGHNRHYVAGRTGMDSADDTDDEITELDHRLRAASLPEHAMKAAQKELKVQL